MKRNIIMTIASIVLAFVTVSCTSSSEDLSAGSVATSETTAQGFSVLSYQKSEGVDVASCNTRTSNDEKLQCKILPNGKLWISHKNVVFDNNADIQIDAQLEGNKLIINETGSYGSESGYGYYTLTATVGKMTDGDYTIVIKRNGYARANFRITYDSTQATATTD